MKGILDYSAEILGDPNNIPKDWLVGVPDTTRNTQPCDCGVIKDFKNIWRKYARDYRRNSPALHVTTRSRVCVWIALTY